MTISYHNYKSLFDYELNPKKSISTKMSQIKLNRLMLIRSALTHGLPNRASLKKIPKEIKHWKFNNISPFVMIGGNNVSKFTYFEYLESSEKSKVAFYIGMIFAHLNMESEYGVRFLCHLEKLENPRYTITKNNKSPDFWGLDRNGKSFLVEAKCSTKTNNYIEKIHIKKANQQLQGVSSINDKNSNINYKVGNAQHGLEKVIVATYPNKEYEINQTIIHI